MQGCYECAFTLLSREKEGEEKREEEKMRKKGGGEYCTSTDTIFALATVFYYLIRRGG